MYPRTNYEMTEEDLNAILEACKPTPVMYLSGGVPMGGSPQEKANLAWEKLGKRMGFDYMTVQPSRRGQRFFSAVPTEPESVRQERLTREAEERKQARIVQLHAEIAERENELASL
jgi:hypothetical protein